MEFVSWDDEITNIWKIKTVPNHQPETIVYFPYARLNTQRVILVDSPLVD